MVAAAERLVVRDLDEHSVGDAAASHAAAAGQLARREPAVGPGIECLLEALEGLPGQSGQSDEVDQLGSGRPREDVAQVLQREVVGPGQTPHQRLVVLSGDQRDQNRQRAQRRY